MHQVVLYNETSDDIDYLEAIDLYLFYTKDNAIRKLKDKYEEIINNLYDYLHDYLSSEEEAEYYIESQIKEDSFIIIDNYSSESYSAEIREVEIE